MDIDEAIAKCELVVSRDYLIPPYRDAIRAVLDELAAYREMCGEAWEVKADKWRMLYMNGMWVYSDNDKIYGDFATALDAYRAMKEKK